VTSENKGSVNCKELYGHHPEDGYSMILRNDGNGVTTQKTASGEPLSLTSVWKKTLECLRECSVLTDFLDVKRRITFLSPVCVHLIELLIGS
jgi:hypothetical protein